MEEASPLKPLPHTPDDANANKGGGRVKSNVHSAQQVRDGMSEEKTFSGYIGNGHVTTNDNLTGNLMTKMVHTPTMEDDAPFIPKRVSSVRTKKNAEQQETSLPPPVPPHKNTGYITQPSHEVAPGSERQTLQQSVESRRGKEVTFQTHGELVSQKGETSLDTSSEVIDVDDAISSDNYFRTDKNDLNSQSVNSKKAPYIERQKWIGLSPYQNKQWGQFVNSDRSQSPMRNHQYQELDEANTQALRLETKFAFPNDEKSQWSSSDTAGTNTHNETLSDVGSPTLTITPTPSSPIQSPTNGLVREEYKINAHERRMITNSKRWENYQNDNIIGSSNKLQSTQRIENNTKNQSHHIKSSDMGEKKKSCSQENIDVHRHHISYGYENILPLSQLPSMNKGTSYLLEHHHLYFQPLVKRVLMLIRIQNLGPNRNSRDP